MVGVNDIVITGVGCVTPIGIGREAFEKGLRAGKSAARCLHRSADDARVLYGAPVDDFDGKTYVTPRKALKVMSREVQTAYAAAHLAWQDAGLTEATLEPDRMGVVFGSEMIPGDHAELIAAVRACSQGAVIDVSQWGQQSLKHVFPLWMLRNLPNMPACHIGIAIDARGPNNTIAQEEVSGLLALSEACSVIDRDQADLMVVGAVGSRVTATRMVYRAPGLYRNRINDDDDRPNRLSIPFDAGRQGIVPSEASGVMVIERRSHAVRRGATIYGVVEATASRCGRVACIHAGSSDAIASAAQAVLERADVVTDELAAISLHGFGESMLDITEATAAHRVAPKVPATAFSSYFGIAGAASGMIELIAGVLATRGQVVLPTLGLESLDARCPVAVAAENRSTTKTRLLQLAFTPAGQAAAALIDCNPVH